MRVVPVSPSPQPSALASCVALPPASVQSSPRQGEGVEPSNQQGHHNHQTIRQLGARVPVRRPSGGVVQGDARQDAERGTKGQGRPFVTAPGAAPEGGKSGGVAARPGCRGALLFGYFLLGTQEKVTRRKGERGALICAVVQKINLSPFSLAVRAKRDRLVQLSG